MPALAFALLLAALVVAAIFLATEWIAVRRHHDHLIPGTPRTPRG